MVISRIIGKLTVYCDHAGRVLEKIISKSLSELSLPYSKMGGRKEKKRSGRNLRLNVRIKL